MNTAIILNVEISQLIYATTEQHIFACTIENTFTIPDVGLDLPSWRETSQASEIHTVDLYQLQRENLKYPNDLVPVREAYVTAIANINADQ